MFKYIWICILVVIDAVWLISSIVDVVDTVNCIRKDEQYNSVGNFINCVIGDLEDSTKGFISLHFMVLFIVSLTEWLMFMMR